MNVFHSQQNLTSARYKLNLSYLKPSIWNSHIGPPFLKEYSIWSKIPLTECCTWWNYSVQYLLTFRVSLVAHSFPGSCLQHASAHYNSNFCIMAWNLGIKCKRRSWFNCRIRKCTGFKCQNSVQLSNYTKFSTMQLQHLGGLVSSELKCMWLACRCKFQHFYIQWLCIPVIVWCYTMHRQNFLLLL